MYDEEEEDDVVICRGGILPILFRDGEEEGSSNDSSVTDSGDDGGAFASSTPVPLDDDSSCSLVNLDTAMNPFSSRLPTKPDKIVMSTLLIEVKVSSVKKSNYTSSSSSIDEYRP